MAYFILVLSLGMFLTFGEVRADVYEDEEFYVMQKKDSMFYDSPYVSFAVETSDSLDGANDYTIFYDKKRKQAYIYSETETRYMVLQRDYADCDKTQLANMLLKDLSENKYKVDKNWAGDGNTAVVTARAVTVTYRRGFAAYAIPINQPYK